MLTSLKNPLVKQMRNLHRSQGRKQAGIFLLEGTHLLTEACAVGYPLETLCCTLNWQEKHELLWMQASQQADRVELVSPEVLQAIATTIQPDGVVATAKRTLDKKPNIDSFGIFLETIQDPGNLGAMIRTASAAGVEGVWVTQDSVDLDHPKVLRASAGQWFRLPMATSLDPLETIDHYKQRGLQVLATCPTADQLYWQLDLTQPTLILLGNEGAGLSKSLMAAADRQVKIPISPSVESLNVAITCALMLYEVQRQRGFNPPGEGQQQ